MNRSSLSRSASRPSAAMLGVLLAALLIGCGGGGGGGHSNSGSSSTTTATGTSGTGATFSANHLVYGAGSGDGTTYDVDEIAPTGGVSQTVFAGVSSSILLFAANPNVAGEYAIAADPTGSGTYGIYLSKDLTLTGTKTLVAPTYGAVASLAVTPDGSRVVYSATNPSGLGQLFVVATAGGSPSALATSDGSAVSPADGDAVVYVAPVGGSGNDAVFRRSLATGTTTQLTTNAENHALPAFSRDGTKLAFWTLASGGNALLVDALATGTLTSIPGVSGLDPQGEAFGPDGTALALVAAAGTTGKILTVPADGSASPTTVLSSASLLGNYGLYWTDASGRVVGGMSGMSGAVRRKSRS